MMDIDAGRLKERLSILVAERTPDGAGGGIVAWVAAGSLWADVTPLSAGHALRGERGQESRQYSLLVRNTTLPAGGIRFLWRGRKLDLRTQRLADAGGRFLLLECEEIS